MQERVKKTSCARRGEASKVDVYAIRRMSELKPTTKQMELLDMFSLEMDDGHVLWYRRLIQRGGRFSIDNGDSRR